MRVAVIGAGSWGTSVSWLLGGKGHEVALWAREPEICSGVAATRHNPLYMREVELPHTVECSTDFERVLSGADAVVIVTPSHGVRETAEALKPHLPKETPVINLAKGLEQGSLMRMTEVLEDVLGNKARLAALSGPNHAEEVGRGIPSATVVAAHEDKVARLFQDVFMTPFFRVYTNPDVVGVEFCGTSKNVIAVASGISDGLGYGDNSKASLMTRGLAEMSRVGRRLGANQLTFMGLAGMGDLIATCTSRHSRNRGLGEHVAKGGTVQSYTEETQMVAEGARACVAVDDLGTRMGVELPITRQVRAILHEGEDPREAVTALMMRGAIDELHGMGLVED